MNINETMTIEEIIQFLSEYNDEEVGTYDLELTRFARRRVENFENNLLQILNGEYEDQIKYNAFYCLNIILRRVKDFDELSDLHKVFKEKFKLHKSFNHLEVLYLLESGFSDDYDSLLEKAYNDLLDFNDNAGVVHLFADVYATIYERGSVSYPKEYVRKWGEQAEEAVNLAIKLVPEYAKFYCTKARVCCIKGEYEFAEKYINIAISKEDSFGADYVIRISNYQYYRLMIYTERRLANILKKEEENYAKFSFPKAYSGKGKYVFISYSHDDTPQVIRLISALQDRGINVWYDEGLCYHPESWRATVAKKIQGCSFVLYFVSDSAVNSKNVKKEIDYAVERNRHPHLINLSEFVPTDEFEFSYHNVPRYDMTIHTEEQFADTYCEILKECSD